MATEQQHRHSGRQGRNDGVYGTSASGNGVQGNVSNLSAGVAGVNHGAGPGIYGENQSGGYAGDFFGDVIVGGSITYSGSLIHSSDARFKEDIAPIRDALDGILRLRGVTFDWRRDEFPERRFRTGRDVGFIAQEVGEVYPELVVTDRDGYKSVDYAAVTPILVEAIKAQQRKIDSQQREIDELTERLARQKRRGRLALRAPSFGHLHWMIPPPSMPRFESNAGNFFRHYQINSSRRPTLPLLPCSTIGAGA